MCKGEAVADSQVKFDRKREREHLPAGTIDLSVSIIKSMAETKTQYCEKHNNLRRL